MGVLQQPGVKLALMCGLLLLLRLRLLLRLLLMLLLLPLGCSWWLLRGGGRAGFPLLDPLGHRSSRATGEGLLVGERVVPVGLVLGAGSPRGVPWERGGLDLIFRQGLGIIVVEGCSRAGVFGLADAWLLAPAFGSQTAGGLGGRQISGKEAETDQ